mmetsp:Transcript_45119/g.59817  ORF Transcript_45119/g.59817 Transcript_45119/m.59817 type:complete len:122 (-) Transcript_45119:2611-2976(-)
MESEGRESHRSSKAQLETNEATKDATPKPITSWLGANNVFQGSEESVDEAEELAKMEATQVSRKDWSKVVNRLIELLRMQSRVSDGEKPRVTQNMISYLQSVVPEFENFNHLSLACFIQFG